ncbi:MAG TPA: kelch repeat-containing protein [Polyangiaceae bacterium]
MRPFLIFALVPLLGCSSSSGTSSQGSPADAGDAGDDGAVALSPNGDPPACANPAEPSDDPPPLADVQGVLDVTATKFVAFGGDTGTPSCGQPPAVHKFIGSTYVMDVACGAWQKAAGPGPSARGRMAMALDPTANHAVLFGGRTSPSGSTYTVYGDVWTFDFATAAWSQVQTSGTGPSARANTAAVVDATANTLVVFGGNTSTDGATFTPQNDTWTLDLGSGAWKAIATGGSKPPAREFHAMALDRDARVAYVFAGGDANAFFGPFLSDVWALDLASGTWKQVQTTGTGPGGRIEPALVFDAASKRLVAFAGHDDGATGNENDVFALDLTASPATWSKIPGGDTPGTPATGQCTFPPDFTHVDVKSPERRSAFAWGPRVDGRGFAVFAGDSDCGLLADSWWWSGGSGNERWATLKASPVGLSCLRTQTTCKGLCG